MSDAKCFTFNAEWYDRVADMVKTLRLQYFTNGCIQINEASGRLFLKKMEYPELSVGDLFIGNTVMVHGRQLNLVAYGDAFTERHMEVQRGRAFGLVKPAGLPDLGQVLAEARDNGYLLNQCLMARLSRRQAADAFGDPDLAGGPVVAFELVDNSPNDAVATWRQLAGTINAKLGYDAVHAAASVDEARSQARIFFSDASELRNTATLRDCTLCIIKPTAVRDGQAGPLIAAVMAEGFEVSALQLMHLDADTVDAFMQAYRGVIPAYSEVVKELSSGALIAIELRGEGDVVERFREACGPVDTQVAQMLRPRTLRARFGVSAVCNALHCTDLPEDGVLECQYIFDQLQA